MKPCPACGCLSTKLAFSIRPGMTTVAVACYRCEHTGPAVGPIRFPPDPQDGVLAAEAWDKAIAAVRHKPRLAA